MTKNTSHLYFSFVFKDLLAFENACNSFCSGRRIYATVIFTAPFFMGNSNARPDMEYPYRAARARTIPEWILLVKLLTQKVYDKSITEITSTASNYFVIAASSRNPSKRTPKSKTGKPKGLSGISYPAVQMDAGSGAGMTQYSAS